MIFPRFQEPVDTGKVSGGPRTRMMQNHSMSIVALIYQAQGVMSKHDRPGEHSLTFVRTSYSIPCTLQSSKSS